MTARKGLPVEYREIRYTVRARIERNEWSVSIHPGDIEGARRVVTGPRERAELLARSMINRWYERAPRAQRGAVNLDNREARRIAANIAKQPELVRDRSVSRISRFALILLHNMSASTFSNIFPMACYATDPDPSCAKRAVILTQCAMAQLPKLSELQNCASTLSNCAATRLRLV